MRRASDPRRPQHGRARQHRRRGAAWPSLSGAVIVDSPVKRPDPESKEGEGGKAFRNPKTYPDLDTAIAHFHLIPEQPCENAFMVDHVARHSLHRTEAGWTWKFDPRVFLRFPPRTLHDYLARVRCRVALMRGEFSALSCPRPGSTCTSCSTATRRWSRSRRPSPPDPRSAAGVHRRAARVARRLGAFGAAASPEVSERVGNLTDSRCTAINGMVTTQYAVNICVDKRYPLCHAMSRRAGEAKAMAAATDSSTSVDTHGAEGPAAEVAVAAAKIHDVSAGQSTGAGVARCLRARARFRRRIRDRAPVPAERILARHPRAALGPAHVLGSVEDRQSVGSRAPAPPHQRDPVGGRQRRGVRTEEMGPHRRGVLRLRNGYRALPRPSATAGANRRQRGVERLDALHEPRILKGHEERAGQHRIRSTRGHDAPAEDATHRRAPRIRRYW